MEDVVPFDWYRMFIGKAPILFYLEIIFRVVVIYIYAILLLRFIGKRGNRGMSIFENVLIIALGSAMGDSLFYPEVPLFFAFLVITLIVLLNRGLQWLQLRSKPVNTFLDGYPILMVRAGKVDKSGLEKARIRIEELHGMLRLAGYVSLAQIEYAFLERSGSLSIIETGTDRPESEAESILPETLGNR